MNANNTKNTTTMSTIYRSLLGVLMTFACLIAVDVISPQNVFILAAAVISVIGVIVYDVYRRRKEAKAVCCTR